MFALRTRALTGLAILASACGLAAPAQAQLFPWINPCGAYGQPMAPMAMAPTAMIHTAAISDCPCMKPVTETVYQDVQRIDYQPQQKVVKAAKVVTVLEDQNVTSYQTVTEARTVEVPSYISQAVTEYRPVTYNQSYYRTAWQPITKASPCQYDNRPGMLGEFNRIGLAMRNSFTPNYVARREFVPNVVSAQVPIQRTMQIPTTRQVTYNVSRVVPTTTTQKVPVQKVVWEDQTVTAMVPVTTTQRVAVGMRTRMAYVDPNGTTSASREPTPTAASPNSSQNAAKGTPRLQSSPTSEPPIVLPTHRREAEPVRKEAAPETKEGPVATTPAETPSIVHFAGWHATRRTANGAQPVAKATAISVVQK